MACKLGWYAKFISKNSDIIVVGQRCRRSGETAYASRKAAIAAAKRMGTGPVMIKNRRTGRLREL